MTNGKQNVQVNLKAWQLALTAIAVLVLPALGSFGVLKLDVMGLSKDLEAETQARQVAIETVENNCQMRYGHLEKNLTAVRTAQADAGKTLDCLDRKITVLLVREGIHLDADGNP